jgi:hypothetical protein
MIICVPAKAFNELTGGTAKERFAYLRLLALLLAMATTFLSDLN